ncbi:MAG: ribosome recycling factor [Deltaproteobacteria bacterium]|nr:ribosome recycling factor [Deltaproteobacteria bacterium]
MSQKTFKNTEDKMNKTIESLKGEFSKVRTGRASTKLLDTVKVDAYGTQCPLNQVATLSVPESKMLIVQPFDPHIVGDIEKAILAANLGLTPSNDGKVIRITMPPLTEERRKDLVKVVKQYAEEARVAIRHHRRDANDEVKNLEKSKVLSEDDARNSQKNIQDLTDRTIKKIDELALQKEKEIMQV